LELSGGEQQRVAIARALANNPAVILADEPTGNLDSVNAHLIAKIFKELRDEGKTIVMVTHNIELTNYADRIVKLRDGQIIEVVEK
jgi:putative ABC transport system ATP-binding protein